MDSNSEHFYSIRVYCEEMTTNSAKNWPMIDENDKYNFKTYTKRSTMVVFNSEARQCTDSNTYRIKVWAVHKKLLYFDPSGPPLLNYVCKSNGNSERRHISFLNQFDLQIVPMIPKDDDNIYYVETQCHNKGNGHQTFKSVTSGGVKILLHKFACKSYDITVRKVPKNWTQQIELYKYAIRQIKDATELNVNIDNGYVYIFDYEKLIRTNRRWRSAGPSSNANFFDLNVEDYVVSDDDKMEEEDRKETELNKARMDETDDDCFYHFN
ncbi:hypothetical protein niasHT_012828 [Heterodera trifolii]|uniref:Uncharacterized protein n=1 Tax=Heterodera trifolii TaxID=157864 RepID=A0ABD2KWV4_9BILA